VRQDVFVTGSPLPAELRRVHLVGMGGAGMSGIARILLARGAQVSGSDAKDSRRLAGLRALGATVTIGHSAAAVGDVASLVVSGVIPPGNAELLEAHRRGINVISRTATLAKLMAGSRGLAVAGTHGKTTTTSMVTVALQSCGVDPSFTIGGDLNEAGSNAHAGSGRVFVAEADENKGAFLQLAPQGAVVANVEAEHLDHYRTAGAVTAAFEAFVTRIEAGGFVVLCADDVGAAALAAPARRAGVRVTTYGERADADLRLSGVRLSGRGSTAEIDLRGERLGTVSMQVPGRHNLLNAAAALAAGIELGLPDGCLRAGLATFTGVRRRFEPKGAVGGVRVVDDYANHPTKIRAVLDAARLAADGGRVIVAFQPHLYSRTGTFARQLGEALGLADAVVVMDVFGAAEEPLPGISGATVAATVPLPADLVVYEPSWSAAADRLAELARPGDLVLTIGAGDVTLLGPELLRVLDERSALGERGGEPVRSS
jgi:UDP-N-acetylmuramate--alanine ligase